MKPDIKYFNFEHLPPHLAAISQPFGLMARQLADTLPECAEKDVALRKLLEAKDAAVRARLESPA